MEQTNKLTNKQQNMNRIFAGLVSSLWFVGMAIGYVVGGQALKLYVDFDTVLSER